MLRQGLREEHVLLVVVVCAVSDTVLVVAAVLGAGALIDQVPWLLPLFRLGGAGFLLSYAAVAARRAARPNALRADAQGARTSAVAALGTVLALTWLNPHVYLDTVVLLGSIAQTYGEDRLWFAAGAATASCLWFSGLGWGARLLRPLFARPAAWRVLDGLIAVVTTSIAVSLLLS